MSFTIPDDTVHKLVQEQTISPAAPSAAVIFLSQMKRAVKELGDDNNLAKIAKRDLKYFDMAAAIVAEEPSGNSSHGRAILKLQNQYGRDLDAVMDIAALIRKVAVQKEAETVFTNAISGVTTDTGVDVKQALEEGATAFV